MPEVHAARFTVTDYASLFMFPAPAVPFPPRTPVRFNTRETRYFNNCREIRRETVNSSVNNTLREVKTFHMRIRELSNFTRESFQNVQSYTEKSLFVHGGKDILRTVEKNTLRTSVTETLRSGTRERGNAPAAAAAPQEYTAKYISPVYNINVNVSAENGGIPRETADAAAECIAETLCNSMEWEYI